MKKLLSEQLEPVRNERSISQMMLDALDTVREVLESYRDSMNEKKQEKAMPHIKEALRALAGEKHSSKKAAYQAAIFVRKAYEVRGRETSAKAAEGDLEAADKVLREMGDESLALRALGYGTDDYNPMVLQAKLKHPPLVRFEKLTPAPEHDSMVTNERFKRVKKEARKRGLI